MSLKKIAKGFLFFIAAVPLLFVFAGCGKKSEEGGAGGGKVWMEMWRFERPLTKKRAGVGAVVIGGKRIYAVGGGEFSGKGSLEIFNTVEYADILDDGSLSEWKPGPGLNIPRVYLTATVYGDHIYVMGGESLERVYTGQKDERAPVLLDTIERARINPDGTIGEWVLEKEKMNFPRRGGVVYGAGGWLYAGGGFSGDFLNDVEMAKINPDGSLGKWQEAGFFHGERYISGYAQKNDRLYVMGGHINSPVRAMDSVEVATGGGKLEWKETSPLYTRRFLNTALVANDAIYALAGHNTVNLTATEKASINSDGTLGKWEPDTPLNIPRRAVASVVAGGRIYLLGGMVKPMAVSESVAEVESARIESGKKLGNWVKDGGPEHEAYKKWKAGTPVDALGHMEHAQAYLKMQKYETVLYDIEEALKEFPKFIAAYNMKADVYFRMGKKDLAEEALKKSLDIAPDNFDALGGLGFLSFERADYKAAAGYFKKALELKPDSEDAHFNLGNAYYYAGDKDAAASELKWVVDNKPASPASQEAKHLLSLIQSGKKN